MLLVFVECRADKLPQDVYHNWERQHQCQPERRGHVNVELRRQLNVDEVDVEIGRRQVIQAGEELRKAVEPLVEHETAVARGENHTVEQLGHEYKQNYRHAHEYADNFKQGHAQRFHMVPKRHVSQIGLLVSFQFVLCKNIDEINLFWCRQPMNQIFLVRWKPDAQFRF